MFLRPRGQISKFGKDAMNRLIVLAAGLQIIAYPLLQHDGLTTNGGTLLVDYHEQCFMAVYLSSFICMRVDFTLLSTVIQGLENGSKIQ